MGVRLSSMGDMLLRHVSGEAARRGVKVSDLRRDDFWEMLQEPCEQHVVYRAIVGTATLNFYPHKFLWRVADGRTRWTVVWPRVIANGDNDWREDASKTARTLLARILEPAPKPNLLVLTATKPAGHLI